MRKLFIAVAALLFSFVICPLSIFGQGARYNDTVINSNGMPVPAATVYVCSISATGTPCSPTASIFSDEALTVPMSSPITTDRNGRYGFWILPGSYLQQVSGYGITTYTQPITVGAGGGGSSLGNGTTVIDLTTITNYQTIAAADLAQLYTDGAIICEVYTTCALKGDGLTGAAYPWTTWDIVQPLTASFPSAIITKSVDNYRPMIIEENLSGINANQGGVTLVGQGKNNTSFYNNTENDTIINRSTNGQTQLTVNDLTIHGPDAATGGCGFSTGIDADGGLPNSHNPQLNASDVLVAYSRFGLREDTSYTDVWTNIRSLNCTGLALEGGFVTATNWYGDDHRAGGVSTRYWQGSQFIAGESYGLNQLVMPRNTTTGHIYKVSVAGTTGATPPVYPTGGGSTVVSGTATFQEVGQECYEWWPGYSYPAGSCVQDYMLGGGHIFKTTLGGISGTLTPTWTYAGGNIADNTITWTDQGGNAQSSYQSDPGLSTIKNALLEEAPNGDGFDMLNGNLSFGNVDISIFTNWGLFCGPNENNQNVGCTPFTWNGGQVVPQGRNAVGGINLGESFNFTLSNIVIDGNNSGPNTGTGILSLCSAGAPSNRNISVSVLNWTTPTNYASGCGNPGLNQTLATGGYTSDGPATFSQYYITGTPPSDGSTPACFDPGGQLSTGCGIGGLTGLPAGTVISTVDTGTPSITFGTNSVAVNQPLSAPSFVSTSAYNSAFNFTVGGSGDPGVTASTLKLVGPASIQAAGWNMYFPGTENGSGGILHAAAASSHKTNLTISALVTADLPAADKVRSCIISLGDGLNAIPAATYPIAFQCKNDTGATLTVTGVSCASSNAGATTCDVATNAPSDLLTGPITASTTWVAGTQSATTTITSGQWLKGTFVCDGTTTIVSIDIAGTL